MPGHSWVVAIRELSSIQHSVTFEVIESEPSIVVSSILHTITLRRIAEETFIEWVTDFSSDVTANVVLDSQFKRKEAFVDLTVALTSAIAEPASAANCSHQDTSRKGVGRTAHGVATLRAWETRKGDPKIQIGH